MNEYYEDRLAEHYERHPAEERARLADGLQVPAGSAFQVGDPDPFTTDSGGRSDVLFLHGNGTLACDSDVRLVGDAVVCVVPARLTADS